MYYICRCLEEARMRLCQTSEQNLCQTLNASQQNEGESLEDFLQRLKILSNDCNFVDVTASAKTEDIE